MCHGANSRQVTLLIHWRSLSPFDNTGASLPSFLTYLFGFFLLGCSHWLGASFDNPSIDQILYHLHYSDGMGFDIGRIFLLTFVVECLAFPLLLAAGATALQSLVSRLIGGHTSRFGHLRGMMLPAVAAACGLVVLMLKLSVFSWVGYHFAEDRFSEAFVDPAQAELRPGRLKNLVLIYVESLEDTYGDARIWGRDLLSPLRDLGGASFAHYRSAPGATWTIAGMVATQCGVPLRVVSHYDIKQRSPDVPAFLPGATCLGDILHRYGYRNVFLGGAPLSFAGKGRFLHDHHYDDAYGREEWLKSGAHGKAFGEWGLYDADLYAQARAKLAQLHASGQPFNLTLLTLDTHNPHGFVSPSCRLRGVKSFEDIVKCASYQAAEFVRHIEQSGYLKDTNVVILGDHLAVSNTVYDTLRKVDDRRIFNRFISERLPSKNTEEILPFDLFPSILEFVGIEVPGGRLGLGYSGFSAFGVNKPAGWLDETTLPSLSGSSGYARLWAQPE
jgi:phosphoglycerol transferase